MKVLHILSDWKWTGPAEPVLNLCLGLKQRGCAVTLACYPTPGYYKGRSLSAEAQKHGLNLLHLDRNKKTFAIISDGLSSIRKLRSWLRRETVDIVHTHRLRDQVMIGLVTKGVKGRPLRIWSNHKGLPMRRRKDTSYTLKNYTDGYITLSPKLLSLDQSFSRLPVERLLSLDGAVNLERFRPIEAKEELRVKLGLPKDVIIGGIVARMQRHRRFDVLLKAVKLVVEHLPQFRLIVIGRGTHRKEVAIEPAQRMGLAKHVIFSGYHTTDYVEMLAAFDFGIFLVPGSDGSCRAVREMMAMGKPVLVAQRGILPEIIEDGMSGLVINDNSENLAQAILKLARDKLLIEKLGKNARDKAIKDFNLERQAERLEGFYRRLLSRTS